MLHKIEVIHPVAVLDHGVSHGVEVPRTGSAPGRKLSYRPDIDGLRAFAVLSVLTFHFFPARARGGFVGVDIFFVISGYLISAIIYNEIDAGSFSIAEFYVRRIRRIYPALFLILIFASVAGWIFLLPSGFILLGKQIVGGSTFVANVVLWLQSGYFSVESDGKPLLHLWSLGVEEQFYLIFPVLCILLFRAKSRWILPGTFLAFAIGSMAVNVTYVDRYRDATFFLPFSRLWELLIGTALALFLRRDLEASPLGRILIEWRTAIGLLGLALLLFSTFRIDRTMSFPGWWCLLPTVGSALVIGAGPDAWSNRHIFSCRPAVFLGLISYPLYLWHWPLLSFARIATNSLWGSDLSSLSKGLLALLSIALAYLTFRLIELPVRRVREKQKRRRGALWLLGSVFVTGIFGFVVVKKSGFPARWPSEAVALDHEYVADAQRSWREGTCFLRLDQAPSQFAESCVDSGQAVATAPLVFVWGDSHAADLISGFRAVQRQPVVRLAQYTSTICPPFIGVKDNNHPECMKVNNYALDRIRTLKPAVVVLSAYWEPLDPRQTRAERASRLVQTIELVKSGGVQKIVVVGSAPAWTNAVPALMIDKIMHDPRHLVPQRLSRELLTEHDDTLFKEASRNAGAIYLSLFDDLCDQTSCIVSTGPSWQDVLTYDRAHFTDHGSLLVAKYLWPAIQLSGS